MMMGLAEAEDRSDLELLTSAQTGNSRAFEVLFRRRYVFAVPPFQSDDFSFERAHLQEVYAEIVRGVVRSIPGSVVVDLANAHEIAKELALTPGPNTVRRDLPYYFVGRFRFEGVDDARSVTLSVEIRQGDKTLEKVAETDLASTAVGDFLDRAVLAMASRHVESGVTRCAR